jgi:hypothetical protein
LANSTICRKPVIKNIRQVRIDEKAHPANDEVMIIPQRTAIANEAT